ncbi:MAG: tRNA (adenosine(37)-N6)-threonylcarbamoyltransferase complex dimerization subunit type 1 TsaB [Flavobacteriaceae bacterium]|nr:tRNA (adenosine(37)-N6)-threonylcarbamoyltransferase complex dimerization subunit type 1 TsaB [Flavobacteriaceae bacterium]
MAFILNIETSTKKCSVSVSKDNEVIALQELNDGNYSHSEKLHLFIQKAIDEAGISMSDLSAVAVSKGPGSYTGLRIGVSTAKGLCFALEIPLISISTLQALALQIQERKGVIIPLLDARRMEVYSAVFSTDNQFIRETKAEIIDENSFKEYLSEQTVYFLGDGATKCKDIILHSNAVYIDNALPSAKEMALLSYQKWKQKDFEDVAYFEPFYLKDFVVTKSKK